jgi:glycosyltransferase involved in cell wall biosynthesis
VLEDFSKINNAYLLFVGSGNEFDNLKEYVENRKYLNIGVYQKLEKEYFDILVAASDVGLVFLDYRFTIANIPSRTLTYMEFSLPILAATDEFTDYKDFIVSNKLGLWIPSNDKEQFIKAVYRYLKNECMILEFGSNARKFLEANLTSKNSYKVIMRNIIKEGKNVR